MKKKKPRAVNYELIPELTGNKASEPYVLLDEIREEHHDDTAAAKVALAWRMRLKADVDGHLVLGKCIKVSDLQKEFAAYDFIIVLNREVWDSIEFTREKKLALLDHELCHAAPSYDDETGEIKMDDRGRRIWRVRKHDIEEFQAIVERHGTYKRDLERFAQALLRKKKTPLFNGSKDETTVSIGMENSATGKMEYTEPMPADTFSKLVDKISNRKM